MRVIDISKWQAGLDIGSTGAEGVICKATQGTTYVDPSCDTHYQKAKKLGMKLGVYHYASGGDPIAEADFFVNNIQGYLGEAILALDWESTQNPRFGEHASWCLPFLKRVEERTGIKPLIYMSASVIRQADWTSVVANNTGLWVAGYPDNRDSWDVPSFPYNISPWPFYAIWQYTSSGGKLDRDIFQGDAAAWDKYVGKKGESQPAPAPVPAPAPKPEPKPDYVEYVVKPGDTLSQIAARYGTTYQKIAADNGIADPNKIYPNQVLKIYTNNSAPKDEAVYYTIRPGDTLSAIASKFGTTWQKLAEMNGIENPDLIFPSVTIRVK